MDDLKTVKNYLSNSIVTIEAKEELIGYLNEAFNRIIYTFKLIPDLENGKLLEIGANPYFLSLLIKKYKKIDMSLANYFGENCTTTFEKMENERNGEINTFDFLNINIEKKVLPYPDKFFDVIIYGEVIEHLTENPVFSLHNLYRVLKDDGILIISTPNVFRYHNLKKILIDRKISFYDPYSAYGIYGRHNRKYSFYEIKDLLENTGFSIIHKNTLFTKDKRGFNKLFSKIIEVLKLGDYLVFKAEKKRDFNWYFPSYLYHGTPKPIPAYNYIAIGKNCAIQLGTGWYDIEKWDNIGNVRWTKKNAVCYLKPQQTNNSVFVKFFSGFDSFEFALRVYQKMELISEFRFIAKSGWGTISHKLPETSLDPLSIEFDIKNSWIPQIIGINEDGRELGIAIHEIRLF